MKKTAFIRIGKAQPRKSHLPARVIITEFVRHLRVISEPSDFDIESDIFVVDFQISSVESNFPLNRPW
jgi:hypothetical protein